MTGDMYGVGPEDVWYSTWEQRFLLEVVIAEPKVFALLTEFDIQHAGLCREPFDLTVADMWPERYLKDE